MRSLTLLCAGLATFALALGYAAQALWAGVGVDVAISLLWLASDWRGWDVASEPCLVGWVGLAAFGAWLGCRPAGCCSAWSRRWRHGIWATSPCACALQAPAEI